ncbi:MAG TPA: glutamine amidotransferase [Myxococcota bacterium]
MIRPLVVKAGTTVEPVRARRGDFEDWIAAGLGIARDALDVVAPYQGEALPDAAAPPAVLLTGSASMVSEREAWSERTAEWLAAVVRRDTPVLGICYGHQLLAHALGGRVGPNPRGREIGSVALRLRPEAHSDPLLGVLDGNAVVHETHVESVLDLPPGARHLAESDGDPHQAFAVGARAWGVQFHPEFDADVIRGYLDARAELLRSEGLDPEALARGVVESPAGTLLLRRFAQLLRG